MQVKYFLGCFRVGAVKALLRLPTLLSIMAVAVGTVPAMLAANGNDLIAQGYRWVTVDGPYACPSKADLQQITRHRTDNTELEMVEQLRAYYLIPGTIVQVVQVDTASGMSKVRAAGMVRDLWTFTKFLTRHAVKDPYGVIETPETARFDADQRIGQAQLFPGTN
jgi:hypothetical protein